MKTITYNCDDRIFQIFVGTNAKENWALIDSSDKFDLWFHVDGFPSGHVIVKEILSKNKIAKDFPYELIIEGAIKCKNQSKLKNEKCKIVYTTIENVIKGKEIGSVFTKNEKYVIV